ncbi:MAG: hypothetical protein ACREQP_09020 [Candidatus Binatia bacterium]
MMRFVFIVAVFTLALCYPASAVRAEEPQSAPGTLEFLSPSQSSLPPFVMGRRIGTSKPAKSLVLLNLGKNSLTVKTQYFEKPVEAASGLTTENQAQGQLSALATSSIIDRLLSAEGELAYTSFNSRSVDSQHLDGLADENHRLFRFGAKGTWADFMYGAEYRSVGKDFINLSGAKLAGDQEGGELWVQKNFGLFTVKTSLSDFTNNIAEDPTLPQMTTFQGGANLSYARPSWPVFSVFYSKGSQSSANEPSGFHPRTGSIDTVGTSLYYNASKWDTTLSSTYSLSDMTVKPAGRYRLSPSEVQTNTPVLSLALNYRPTFLPVQISTFGSYTHTEASDGYTNSDILNLSAAMAWNLGESRYGKNTLSLGTTFNRNLDNVNPDGSNQDLSVWVRLKVAAF